MPLGHTLSYAYQALKIVNNRINNSNKERDRDMIPSREEAKRLLAEAETHIAATKANNFFITKYLPIFCIFLFI